MENLQTRILRMARMGFGGGISFQPMMSGFHRQDADATWAVAD
jgi:hypothetical protein